MNRVAPSQPAAPRNAHVRDDRLHDAQERDMRDHERAVLQAIRDTAFGTVEVTVHQSRIVQITRSEKLRL